MPTFPSAPLWRRLAALGYDILLLGAVMFVSVGLLVWLYQFTGLPMVELNGVAKPPAWFSAWVIRGVLLLLIVGFYGYFWRHGGQSLGMRAWRIRTERQDQRRLSRSEERRVGKDCRSRLCPANGRNARANMAVATAVHAHDDL